jgi:hypothetical protein
MLTGYFCVLAMAFWPLSQGRQMVLDDKLEKVQVQGVDAFDLDERARISEVKLERLDGCEAAVGSDFDMLSILQFIVSLQAHLSGHVSFEE